MVAAALIVLSGVVALVLAVGAGGDRLLLGIVAVGSGALGLLLSAAPPRRRQPRDPRIWMEPYGPPVTGGDLEDEDPRPPSARTTQEIEDSSRLP